MDFLKINILLLAGISCFFENIKSNFKAILTTSSKFYNPENESDALSNSSNVWLDGELNWLSNLKGP